MCLEYLHSKNIVYRDLKPENSVCDESGYLYMIDMGTAKFLTEDSGYRSFTIIGTPHYMAPEILEGKGYGFAADIWSLGIMFYEMVFGNLPFGEDFDDPYDIYKDIEKSNLYFPLTYKDSKGKDVMKRLMVKNQEKREVEDFNIIKTMPFFQRFDWEGLLKKQMPPPYRPKCHQLKEKKNKNILMSDFLEPMKNTFQKPKKSAVHPNWDEKF